MKVASLSLRCGFGFRFVMKEYAFSNVKCSVLFLFIYIFLLTAQVQKLFSSEKCI